ncbi:hypothetical protein DY000_02002737 [Brassica cretica]|uniref:Uncharacterized protein n=1 Tax=Brassica cretica TaxID=69181 RepID=A0ABQ7C9P7_BRACR|nr:hypothetical protein DY000_02002737 [Brassica cretica]
MVNWRGESEVGEDRRASEIDKMSCETWITREVRRKDMMEAVAEPAQPPLRYIDRSRLSLNDTSGTHFYFDNEWRKQCLPADLRTIAHVNASNTGEEEIDKKAGSSAKKIRKYYTV